MLKRKITTIGLWLTILVFSLFLSGCSEKPYLAQDGSYVILTISPSGMTQSEIIKLPWNKNIAVLQTMLIESSFVLSDLHTPSTPSTSESTNPDHIKTIRLQANYPDPKRMSFVVDQHVVTLDVQSIQIEVEGANVGQVTINQSLTLQGIKNPNLQPAFEALTTALHDPS